MIKDSEIKDGAESLVKVDPDNLGHECRMQPSNYLKFAHLAADLKDELSGLNAELSVIEADVAKAVRDTPGKFGLEKTTEAAIKEVVKSHKRVRDQNEKVARMQHKLDLAQAAVWAMEHKKRALTLLVQLHAAGYFADLKFSGADKKSVDKMMQSEARRRIQVETRE